MTHPRQPYQPYLVVLALTAVALFISLTLKQLIEPNFFLPFLAAVFLGVWFYGLRPGLAATALSTLAIAYFFMPVLRSPVIWDWNEVGRLVAFLLVALPIVKLVSDLRSSRGLLSATLSSIGDAVVVTDRHGVVNFINPVAEELTGWTKLEAHGKSVHDILRLVNEKTRAEVENPVDRAIRQNSVATLANYVVLIAKDGAEIPIEDSAAPIRDSNGKLCGVILVFRNVSSRRHLEDQVSQSQKMEAVGRLAGGVAGDFNNLLTIITGYSELLRSDMVAGNPLRRFAEEILYAAERAAGLTRQLLAFSRGQSAQPKMLDLNSVIGNLETMLRRLLGEKIELLSLPGPGLGRVRSDAAQIEQVIVNLAMNARDAMPNGGKFVIETANVEIDVENAGKRVAVDPGSYVMIAVSDTGCGMDAETRSRLFEPFFTTKEKGKGSGLGLSIVYGIIKQNQGHITVYSQVDCGTIFEIYLPRAKDAVEVVHRGRTTRPPKGSETILLVDDEEGVRKLCSAVLLSNGYSVLEAVDGAAGLALYERNSSDIDLVLTDVVMPNMNGFELGERLAAKNPAPKILYMSGYRDSPIGGPEGEPERTFLHKPFTPDALLLKIRESLDTQTEEARG